VSENTAAESRFSMASKIARFQTLMPYWKPTLVTIENQEADGKRPGQPVAMGAPESPGADPEPRQQIILADLLGLFGR
jgi:hypothetical protein